MKQLPIGLAFAAGLALGVGAGWLTFRGSVGPAPAANPPAPAAAAGAPVASPEPVVPVKEEVSKRGESPRGVKPTPTAAVPAVPVEDPAVPRLEAALAEARARITELEHRGEAQAAEQAKLTALEGDLRAQVARVAAEADELKRDLQQRAQRVAELESARQKAVTEAAAGARNLARLKELSGEMDDLNRRREAYLNNVLTRYREATDLLRTMSLRLDNPRDAATPLNNDLSRIQQAVQYADEDLRQLRSLNARAVKLQKDLAQAAR